MECFGELVDLSYVSLELSEFSNLSTYYVEDPPRFGVVCSHDLLFVEDPQLLFKPKADMKI